MHRFTRVSCFFLFISTYTLCKLHQENSFPWQTYSCTRKEYITVFGKSFFCLRLPTFRTRSFLWQHFPQPRFQVKQVTGPWERGYPSAVKSLGRLLIHLGWYKLLLVDKALQFTASMVSLKNVLPAQRLRSKRWFDTGSLLRGKPCRVPRPHYSARSMRFGSRGPSEFFRPGLAFNRFAENPESRNPTPNAKLLWSLVITVGQGFLGIQYIWVFDFRYTVFLCLKLDVKYSLMNNFGYKYNVIFLILIFYTSSSVIFDILEGLFRVFWYSTRAKEGGKETSGVLRLPSIPFPWSPAAHHQSLASTLPKTKCLRRRLRLSRIIDFK